MWRTRLKMPFALTIGSVITIGLFGVMQLLISGGPGAAGGSDPNIAIHFGPVRMVDVLPPPQRHIPPKPKPPTALPKPDRLAPVDIEAPTTRPAPDFAGLDLFPGTGGPAGSSLCGNYASSCSVTTTNGDVVALAKIQPIYPRRAALMGVDGYVTIEFTITAIGTVIDASVIDAKPRRAFEDAALKAIVKWKFRPRFVNGQAVARRATQTLEFRLD